MRSSERLREQQNYSNENRDPAPYARHFLIESRLHPLPASGSDLACPFSTLRSSNMCSHHKRRV